VSAPAPAGAYSFRDLGAADADALLDVTRACHVAAGVVLRFDREPDPLLWPRRVLDAHRYVGAFTGGRLVAFGLAGFRRGWLGDRWGEWGYVGDFRVLPAHRGRGLSHRLADALAERVADAVPLWVALVARGNRPGEELRAAHVLPPGLSLAPLADLEVVTLPAWLPLRGGGAVETLEARDCDEAAAFAREALAGRLLAPDVTPDGFDASCVAGTGTVRRCWIARDGRRGRIAGVLVAADLHACRQVTVVRYPGSALPLRLAWGLARHARRGVPALPPPGGALRGLTVSWLAAAGDDPVVARGLLARAVAAAGAAGLHAVHVAFASGDPLRRAVRGCPASVFRSRLSAVVHAGALPALRAALGRPVCFDLELA
jgi:GNAT superfamily N-acetyltransferase